MIRLYLVRHGETMLNQLGRVQGWVDSPLTERGIRDAEDCGRGFREIKIDKCYSSDFKRATDTAKIITNCAKQKQEIIETYGLRELCFGDFDGGYEDERKSACAQYFLDEDNIDLLNKKLQAKEILPRQMMNATYELDQSGFAESYDAVEERASETIKKIVNDARLAGDKHILIVTHGVTISTIIEHFPGEKLKQVSDMKNASVTVLEADEEIEIKQVASMDFVKKGQNIKIT